MLSFERIKNLIFNLLRLAILRSPIVSARVRKVQQDYLDAQNCLHYDTLVIFFVPGFDRVSGGIMSIVSIAHESQKIFANSKTGVFVCTVPSEPPLSKFTKFDNEQILVDYFNLLARCTNAKKLLLHIPEIYISYLAKKSRSLIEIFKGDIQFNMLLQNIDLAPHPRFITHLKSFGPVTITTAHKAYSGEDTVKRYDCPVQHLSTWVSPENFIYKAFPEKKDLIIVSPDRFKSRGAILKRIQNQLPGFEFLTIQNMTYSTYLQTIAEAKFSLTFGEGLDGYFIEPVFSGGIGGAVFNDRFFDAEYRNLPFVYQSWEDLENRFSGDVLEASTAPDKYNIVHQSQFEILANNYSYKNYQSKVAGFYQKYFHEKPQAAPGS